MIFPSNIISAMTEADVRAEIIDVIIARLGYKYSETHYVLREKQLKYPSSQIGHRSRKDMPIGNADYICGVDGRRGSFAIEAKRGNVPIKKDDIIQAHSYAAHSEVGANFFILCNGHVLQIFDTLDGLVSGPVLEICNEKYESEFYKIEALIEPKNLERHSKRNYEITKPIYHNSRASLDIKNGWVSYSDVGYKILGQPQGEFEKFLARNGTLETFQAQVKTIKERRQPIISGKITRDEAGRISAHVEFDSADDLLAKNLRSMDIAELTFFTDSEQISTDQDRPSLFESLSEKSIPVGTKLYDLTTKTAIYTGSQTNMKFSYRVSGHIKNNTFSGQYEGQTVMDFPASTPKLFDLEIVMSGGFIVNIQ
jgi:Type I restriction enzyme R protein N terminus (HSDR_N)